MAIGHRVTLIKGGRHPFFPFRTFVERGSVSPRSDHGSSKKKPVRNDSRMHVTRRICAVGSAYGPESYWRDIHPPPPSPPYFFPFLFPSSRIGAFPSCYKYGGHTGGCDRSPRHGGCERRETHEDFEEGLLGRPNFNRAYKSFE